MFIKSKNVNADPNFSLLFSPFSTHTHTDSPSPVLRGSLGLHKVPGGKQISSSENDRIVSSSYNWTFHRAILWSAKSVERVTPAEEDLGLIPALAARLPTGLGGCQYNLTRRDRSHGLPALSRVWQHVKLSGVSLGTRPRYSLSVDEDVKLASSGDLIPHINHRQTSAEAPVILSFGKVRLLR